MTASTRRPVAFAGLAFAMLAGLPLCAEASQLLAPSIGAPDSAMAGATVATPITPAAAAFSNPAGIAVMGAGSKSFSLGVPVGHSKMDAATPLGSYETDNNFVAYAPELGTVGEVGFGELHWGFAVYGSLGSTFKSREDPAVGAVGDFYSSNGISNIAVMLARSFGDKLSVGASLSAVYAQAHLRYMAPVPDLGLVPYAYTVRGLGVQAMFGLRYQLLEKLALGAGFRTPGMVWASGDDGARGGLHQDVDLDLDLPAQIFVGLNAEPFDRISVGLIARWTDSSSFGNSEFEFSKPRAPDIGFIEGASDEWRVGMGLAWQASDRLTLRGSFGWADDIVPDATVSPLLYDSAEWKIGLGFSYKVLEAGDWYVDFAFGESPSGSRNISVDEANIYPGEYSLSGQIYLLGLRRSL